MKKIVLLTLSFLLTVSLSALDYGLLLIQEAELTGALKTTEESSDLEIGYTASVVPRFSMLIGKSADLFVSARMTYEYAQEPYFIPELLRTEFSWRKDKFMLSLGRMRYTAPFEHVADGLFDGLKASVYSTLGNFYCGVWYTGFLYKNEADIFITEEDKFAYQEPFDYRRFSDTYFASRRLVGAFGWEHPSVAGVLNAKTTLISQTDLNCGDGSPLHSQYLIARFGLLFKNLSFELGGVFQIAEQDEKAEFGLTWDIEISYFLPTRLPSRVSVAGYFSLDDEKNEIPNLVPINSKSFGRIAEISPSGIASLSFDYSARLNGAFSVDAGAMFYIRNANANMLDKNFFSGIETEIYAQAVWAPFSDVMVNFGGGIDFSSVPKWKIKIGMIMALL